MKWGALARRESAVLKFAAVRDAVVFFCKNVGIDPWQSKVFVSFAVLVDLSTTDPRVLAMLEELLPPKR